MNLARDALVIHLHKPGAAHISENIKLYHIKDQDSDKFLTSKHQMSKNAYANECVIPKLES